MSDLKESLNDLARIQGIKAVVVVGRDGFVIDGVTSDEEIDMEAIAALVANGIGAAERIGAELTAGEIGHAMMEYEKGILVMGILDPDAVFACVADLKSNPGSVRYQLKKRAAAVAAAI